MIRRIAYCYALLAVSLLAAEQPERLTFESLSENGVVSGFGIRHGDPLVMKGRISAIDHPIYVSATNGVYPSDLLCIGAQIDGTWSFSPIESLNSHEVVNHKGQAALCFCPLAGLSIALDGDMTVSGLLRYDTFVLYEDKTGALIVPFLQRSYRDNRRVLLREIQLLTYAGVVGRFPQARILDPAAHERTQPYGSYPTDSNPGIGHPRPGLEWHYSKKQYGHHPKEMVLVAGRNGLMEKAYPLAELKRSVPSEGGSFEDRIGEETVTVHYFPSHRWGRVTNPSGKSLNMSYA